MDANVMCGSVVRLTKTDIDNLVFKKNKPVVVGILSTFTGVMHHAWEAVDDDERLADVQVCVSHLQ
jgi:hypothetical protein